MMTVPRTNSLRRFVPIAIFMLVVFGVGLSGVVYAITGGENGVQAEAASITAGRWLPGGGAALSAQRVAVRWIGQSVKRRSRNKGPHRSKRQ